MAILLETVSSSFHLVCRQYVSLNIYLFYYLFSFAGVFFQKLSFITSFQLMSFILCSFIFSARFVCSYLVVPLPPRFVLYSSICHISFHYHFFSEVFLVSLCLFIVFHFISFISLLSQFTLSYTFVHCVVSSLFVSFFYVCLFHHNILGFLFLFVFNNLLKNVYIVFLLFPVLWKRKLRRKNISEKIWREVNRGQKESWQNIRVLPDPVC